MPEFFYHLLPEPMLGHTLYPLASLKSKAPKLAKKLLKNYDGEKSFSITLYRPFIVSGKMSFSSHPSTHLSYLRPLNSSDF